VAGVQHPDHRIDADEKHWDFETVEAAANFVKARGFEKEES